MRTLLDYVIEGELGRGAHAVVHRARRLPGDEVVALKQPLFMDRAARDRLRREARVLSRCVHPHIVPLLDVVAPGTDDPPHALALGLAPGGSLRDLLANRGPLGADEVAGLAGAIAAALAVIHSAGYAHGDVKPGNILLGPDGVVWLADLDSATHLGAEPAGPTNPRQGTMPYLAPEAIYGHAPDPLSDLHALGVTCLEALDREAVGDAHALVELFEAAADDDRSARPTGIAVFATELARVRPGATWTGACPAVVDADRHDQLDDAPTREFGPRPANTEAIPRPKVGANRSRARQVIIAVSAFGLVTTTAGMVATSSHAGPNVDADQPAATSPHVTELVDSEAPTRAECSGSSAQGAEPRVAGSSVGDTRARETQAGETHEADPDGEGCTRPVQWMTTDAEVVVERAGGTQRFRLGQPGDDLVVGDWDGDGRDEPGLYRSSTGEVFLFSGWATTRAPVVSDPVEVTGVAAGRARVVRTAGRDRVIVEPPATAP